jgi:hypothetical protein
MILLTGSEGIDHQQRLPCGALGSDLFRFRRAQIEGGSKGIPCSLKAYAMVFSEITFASSTP